MGFGFVCFFCFVFIRNSPNYPKHRLSKVLEMFPEDLSADSKAISPGTFFSASLMLQTFPCSSENHIFCLKI